MRVETEHFDDDDGNLKSNEDLEAKSSEATLRCIPVRSCWAGVQIVVTIS
jgi:hypothetical protein